MQIRVGIENNFEGHSIAWVLDYPGCFANGSDETEALIRVPQALIKFKSWLEGYTSDSWLKNLGDFDVRLVESVSFQRLNNMYEPDENGEMSVCSFFHHDWLPLQEMGIQQGLKVVEWAHNDLLEMTAALPDSKKDEKLPDERWSIRGILTHVANAEWYYLDRLSLTNRKKTDLPSDTTLRMQATLDNLRARMPGLADMEDVRGRDGEFWSPRKILRRACWHALDHCQHIHRLITGE